MPEDRTILTADGTQYFDVLRRAGVAADRLGTSGAGIGQGFVRGERVVRTASQNISAALLTAGDATSTFLVAASGLERVFRIGIGPTIGIAAGIKAFEIIHEAVKKTNDAYKDLKDELAKPINVDPVTAEADRKIEELTDKIKKLEEAAKSGKSTTGGFFAGLAGIASSAFLPSFLRGPAISALSGLAPVGPAAIARLGEGAAKRLDALVDDRARRIIDAADKLHEALRTAIQKFRDSTGNLFRDIGSGQFLKDLSQRNLENQQTRTGQEMVKEFEDALSRGEALGPNATEMVRAARAAAAKGGVGINDILNADFSNLDALSKYDFSGLAPLSGISIIIQ